MADLKIAIIGCGKQAPKHISGLRKVPGVQLVLADVVPEYAAALGAQEKLPYVQHPDEIFADPAINAVDICTPTPSHASLIRQALAAGKDFFCEKPLCETAAQAHEIEAALHGSDRIGMVGYVYRFAPVFELGQRLCEAGQAGGAGAALGRVVTASFRLGGRGSHMLWKHKKATGGGAISEMLVHMLDLAIWYFGPVHQADLLACELLRPERVIQGKLEPVDAEDFVLARLKMAGGVEVFCQPDLVTPAFTQFTEIQGENGSFMGSIQPDMPSFIYCDRPAAGYPAGKTVLSFGQLNLFEAQMAEFVRAVQTRHQPARCTVHDSVLLLEAIEMLRKGISSHVV